MVKSVLCYGEMWWTLNVFFFVVVAMLRNFVTCDG